MESVISEGTATVLGYVVIALFIGLAIRLYIRHKNREKLPPSSGGGAGGGGGGKRGSKEP
jgi:hypothetical protein